MTVLTYRARYRLDIGHGFREPGELAPEAATWFRRDSYLHTGRIVEVQVEPAELCAAIAKYCPELSEQIVELSGLDPEVALEGPFNAVHRYDDEDPEPVQKPAATKAPATVKKLKS